MNKIVVNEHRVDVKQIAYYHKKTDTIGGGIYEEPIYHFYKIIIGMKSGKELVISCRAKGEQDELIDFIDLHTGD